MNPPEMDEDNPRTQARYIMHFKEYSLRDEEFYKATWKAPDTSRPPSNSVLIRLPKDVSIPLGRHSPDEMERLADGEDIDYFN